MKFPSRPSTIASRHQRAACGAEGRRRSSPRPCGRALAHGHRRRAARLDDDPRRARAASARQDATYLPASPDMLARWAAKLDRPGVLFLGQPISEGRRVSSGRRHRRCSTALRHHPRSTGRSATVAGAARDVLVVSGDVHWSRLRALDLARRANPRSTSTRWCAPASPVLPGDPGGSALPRGRRVAAVRGLGREARADEREVHLATLTFTAGAAGRWTSRCRTGARNAPGAPAAERVGDAEVGVCPCATAALVFSSGGQKPLPLQLTPARRAGPQP